MVEPSSREYLSASGASFFFALKKRIFLCKYVDIRESDADESIWKETMEKSYANAYYLIASLNDKREMKKA